MKKIRNSFHVIVGFTIGYILFILLGINSVNFPIDMERINNVLTPFLGAILVAIPAFFWERHQERNFDATFDIDDICLSATGGFFGGLLAMFFVSWYVIIPMALLSAYLVIFKGNK